MEHIQLAYVSLLYWLLPLLAVVALVRFVWRKPVRYRYSLTKFLQQQGFARRTPMRAILFGLRATLLCALAFLIARPQWVDTQSSVNVQGINIMLVLDVSGSMRMFDDLKDRTPRIEAAKREALDFILKRPNDPIGIVFFGLYALCKVPLTLDKTLLRDVVRGVELGDIDPNGTALLTAVATGISHLRETPAKSKIIVLLTDGIPQDESLTISTVIDLAQQVGVKVYTIGVGQQDVAYDVDDWGRVMQMESSLNEELLTELANKTGGHFFRAYTPADLKKAYEHIDQLEKTEINTNIYHSYYEAFSYFIWWALLLFALELFLRMYWWRGFS